MPLPGTRSSRPQVLRTPDGTRSWQFPIKTYCSDQQIREKLPIQCMTNAQWTTELSLTLPKTVVRFPNHAS
ncbi:hypothetical protein PROAA_2290006 [Candidatus Propionivibrio aalborgensis]|uniref:Uncharacterized protein n=1 Tax=Candidatus Propionivibrio aalborgensis TaxID=1860101 RepID=A0A1A8XR55_9RHOO|nr:hypothetical protein PROAA_2290006 [Candidatus Propionivibrio aalborgensis]